jgi:uncharacterized membrane protein
MPEYVGRVDSGLPTFPAGAGKGTTYSPMKQDMDDGRMRAHAVQTILADPQKLYELWRKVELAPRWQEYVVSVTRTSETVSHWVLGDADDPEGTRLEYDSEIVEDVPGKAIAWRSIDKASARPSDGNSASDGGASKEQRGYKVEESGRVTFEPAPGGRGTRVTLQERINIPGGKLGNAAAAVVKRTPRQIVIEDLRHFKQLAEAGEIPTVEHNPHGPRGFSGSLKARLYGENNPTPPGTQADESETTQLVGSQDT